MSSQLSHNVCRWSGNTGGTELRKEPDSQALPELHFLDRDAILDLSAQKGIFDVLMSDGEKMTFDLRRINFEISYKQFPTVFE